MRKALVAAAVVGGVALSTAGCGGGAGYVNSTYCVDYMTHQVVGQNYCNPGAGYMPGVYDYWVGGYGSYHTGTIISVSVWKSGKTVNPSSASARKAAGLPASGALKNGAKATSAPAKAQNAPKVGASGGTKTSTTKATTPQRTSTGFSGGSKSSSSFGSPSRSSSSFGGSSRSSFSGGRK